MRIYPTTTIKNQKDILIFLVFEASFFFSSIKYIWDFLSFTSYYPYIEFASRRWSDVLDTESLMVVILSMEDKSMFLVSCRCDLSDFIDWMVLYGLAWAKRAFFWFCQLTFVVIIMFIIQKQSQSPHFDYAIKFNRGDSPIFTHTKEGFSYFVNYIFFLSGRKKLEILTALVHLNKLVHANRALFINVKHGESLNKWRLTSAISYLVASPKSMSGFMVIFKKSSSLIF